jgi:hypothetical protein
LNGVAAASTIESTALASVSTAFWPASTVAVAWFDVTVASNGSSAVAVARFVSDPAFRSASVMVWLEVQVVDSPGRRSDVERQLSFEVLSSNTAYGDDSVTLPELVSVYS